MRERLNVWDTPAAPIGITPAYAGKTDSNADFDASLEDHPRVCGKDTLAPLPGPACFGSPPRMRERLVAGFRDSPDSGITPAYAGKTKLANYVGLIF